MNACCYDSPSLSLFALSCHSFTSFSCSSFSPSADNLSRFRERERGVDQRWSMEFLQEQTFAALLALVLSFLIAKIVSFAASNTAADVNNVASSLSDGAAAKEVTLGRELKVRRRREGKRVKFVDEVVIRRVDRYEGFEIENRVLLDDVKEVGEGIAGEKSVGEESGQRVDEFGGDGFCGERKSEEEGSFGEGSGETEMLFEEEADGGVGQHVEALVTSGVEREVGFEGGDEVVDEREGDGEVGCGENQEMVAEEVMEEEEKVRDKNIDEDWEGVERSELEKGFAEAVNYVECGEKGKEGEGLAKLGSDVQLQLYGLHKVALEGPCLEPQPMAFMLSARAKWNAWQRLGSMSRDAAMEHYMQVLSQYIPDWMHASSADAMIERKTEPEDYISAAELERNTEASTSPVSEFSTNGSSVDKVDTV